MKREQNDRKMAPGVWDQGDGEWEDQFKVRSLTGQTRRNRIRSNRWQKQKYRRNVQRSRRSSFGIGMRTANENLHGHKLLLYVCGARMKETLIPNLVNAARAESYVLHAQDRNKKKNREGYTATSTLSRHTATDERRNKANNNSPPM